MTAIVYGAIAAPPSIPIDQTGYASINAFSSYVDNVSWQLYGGELCERNIQIFAKEHYNRYYYYPDFDLRKYYDIDGYILRGYATMKTDPAVGGYVYLCVEKPLGGWSCASTGGTPATAALSAS